MKRTFLPFFSVFLFLFICHPFPVSAEKLRLLYMAQAGYQPNVISQRTAEFTETTGIEVEVSFAEYEDMFSLIRESAKAGTGGYDVILADLIWMAGFVEDGILDPLPPDITAEVENGIIPEIYEAFRLHGRFWALPFLANFQVLYTNMDLLEQAGFSKPPSTLEEMVSMAETAKEKGIIEYPLFDSWKQQEALVCEYLWILGAFGGSLSGAEGEITIAGEKQTQSLEFMRSLLEKGLMNPYSLESDELFASKAYLWGDCLFTTNWTFIMGLMHQIPYDGLTRAVSLMPVHRGQTAADGSALESSTVSGFQGLAVLHNSPSKSDAWRLARFLASPGFQRQHLEEMSVWEEVWQEAWTRSRDPYIDVKIRQIRNVRNRPSLSRYREFSVILQKWLSEALEGRVPAPAALASAQREVDAMLAEDPR